MFEHFQHAEHPVHRRPDLVAHGGEKGGFGPIGVIGVLACPLQVGGAFLHTPFEVLVQLHQGCFSLLALGDVDEGGDGADFLAILFDRVRPVFHRKRDAVLAPEDFIVDVARSMFPVSSERPAFVCRVGTAVGTRMVDELMGASAEHLVGVRISQQAQEGLVDEGQPAVGVDPVRAFIHRVEQPGLLFLEALALGDLGGELRGALLDQGFQVLVQARPLQSHRNLVADVEQDLQLLVAENSLACSQQIHHSEDAILAQP